MSDTYKHATGMSLEASKTMRCGSSLPLHAEFVPNEAFDRNITWSSSNPTVASVDKYGIIKGISIGTAVITAVAEDGGFTSICTVTVIPVDYEITAITSIETVNNDRKDISVSVTYRNNLPVAGDIDVEMLYGGAVYISKAITFTGDAGQTIGETYVIRDIPVDSQNPIEARINYEGHLGETDPNNNRRALAPLSVPIPQKDYAVLFIKTEPMEDSRFFVQVAFQNLSYEADEVPVKINYDDGGYLYDTVTFSGNPFETVVKQYVSETLEVAANKPVSACINWDSKDDEENTSNNIWTVFIDIPN